MRMIVEVAREMGRTFWFSVVGFFVLLGVLVVGLVAVAAGAASALFLVAALYESVRWLATRDAGMGIRALEFWAYAAVAFAVAPLLFTAVTTLRAWPERRRLERIAKLRIGFGA